MTLREKLVAGGLASVLVIGGGASLIRARILEPLADKRAQIAALQQRRDALEMRLAHEARAVKLWQERTARTLGTSPFQAMQLFRDDLSDLAQTQIGLTRFTMRQREPLVERKGPRVGFAELAVTITGEGTLEQISNLLRAMYARPYLVKINSLLLSVSASSTAAERRARKEGAADGAVEPRLSLTLVASTYVLPEVAEAPSTPLSKESLATAQPGPAPLLAEADVAAYDRITRENLFKLYVPEPVVVVRDPEPEPEPQPQPEPVVATGNPTPPPEPEPPPRDPWEGAEQFVLRATTARDGAPAAYVQNDGDLSEPMQRFGLNDALFAGRVVVIHPVGIVLRVYGEADAPPADFLVRLGQKVSDRVPFDPVQEPDVARDLAQAFARGGGGNDSE